MRKAGQSSEARQRLLHSAVTVLPAQGTAEPTETNVATFINYTAPPIGIVGNNMLEGGKTENF